MGAGVSVADNTAKAVASAYESVINTTNVVTQQNNTQTQAVNLNACDITAKGSVTVNESAVLTQAMTQIASISSATSVTNDIAQALSQAAAASVGAGVLGIASASNQASTYANMATNVSNYVALSAIQATNQNQVFSCNNSTIVAGGDVNISLLSTDDSKLYTNYNVDNATSIADTITQTISQTATASTGFSIGGVILILVLACIALLIYKLAGAKSTASHAQQIQEAVAAGCLDASHLDSNGTVMPALSPGSARAGLDVDKLLHPHKYVKPAFWVVYAVFILAAGITLGMWYLGVSQRGCLFDDACGANQDSQDFAGCSCNYDAATDGTPLTTCEDPQMSSFTSTGMPLKYQYPVFYSDTISSAYAPCAQGGDVSQTSPASMQGILVSALKVTSQTYNSNNGKNMDTLMRYVSLVGWPSTVLNYQTLFPVLPSGPNGKVLSLFRAGVDYLQIQAGKSSGILSSLWEAISKGANQLDDQAKLLALFVCPLRLVGVTHDESQSTTSALTADWPNLVIHTDSDTVSCLDATPNWVSTTNFPKTDYLLNVPLAFSSTVSTDSTNDDCYASAINSCAGCCSAFMVKFVNTTTNDSQVDYTNACGSDGKSTSACFCNGFAAGETSCAPSTTSKTPKVPKNDKTDSFGQLKMKLPTLTKDTMPSSGSGTTQVTTMVPPNFSNVDTNTYRPFYAEWADFSQVANSDSDSMFTSFVRLLWAGVLAYGGAVGHDTVYGINALANHAVDHYYVANSPGKSYGRIGDATSEPAELAKDTTLLTIKVLGQSGYSPRTGMPPMPCSGIGEPNANQSYTASAPYMGYCRDWFYNKVTRIIIIVLLVLCVLWLPFYYLMRLYIDRNVGNMYLQEALNATKSSSSKQKDDIVVGEKVKQEKPTAKLQGGQLGEKPSRKTKRQGLLVRSKRRKH